MTANFLTAIFFLWEKLLWKNYLSDLPVASLYIKNFCVAGKNRDWCYTLWKRKGKICWGLGKTHHTEILNKLKEKFLFSVYAAKPSNWTTLRIDLIENFSWSNSEASFICSFSALYTLSPPFILLWLYNNR